MVQDYRDFLAEVLISEEDLQRRITEMGEEISNDYQGEEKLLLVCILRGGVMFLTDLMRQIRHPHAIEFMAVSSYGVGKRETSGQTRITLDLNTDIQDKNVILVEDIIDSGHTLASVLEILSLRKPKSLSVCTLLDKGNGARCTCRSSTPGLSFQTSSSLVTGSTSTIITAICHLLGWSISTGTNPAEITKQP